MADMVKTTITIPSEIFVKAKIKAVREKKSLSKLIREALREKVEPKRNKQVKDPMRLAGIFKLGTDKLYEKRSDLYEEHINRKMGL